MSLRQVRERNIGGGGRRAASPNTDDRGADGEPIVRPIDDPGLAVASRRINGRGKRALDLLLGAGSFALLLPLMATLIGALRLAGGGAALTRTSLIGRRGKPFDQLHFRTPPGRFGAALAATGLARLPGLINVLRGELSLVGAAPVDRDGLGDYGADRRYYLVARPGLVCAWAPEDVKPANLPALCRAYVLTWRLRRDLAVLRAVLLSAPRPRTP
jgi:lipopolysaccharide/colanic/teichoic acid biosynthesis glycosyltransferase